MHKAKVIAEGGDVSIVACGEMVFYAKKAAELLAAEGVFAKVLDMFCLKPADEGAICEAARETKAIIAVEEHSVHGGLGELVCGITARFCPVLVYIMGFPDEECKVGGKAELFEYYGLTPGRIAANAKKLLGMKRF